MKKRTVLPLILAILWTCFIWSNSMKPAVVSAAASHGFLAWLVANFPWLSWLAEHLLRKMAHFAEFAMLGILLGWLFRQLQFRGIHSFSSPLLCGILTAMIDETIQLFPEGRSCEVVDVWIDTAGVSTGILLFLIGLASYFKLKGFSKR